MSFSNQRHAFFITINLSTKSREAASRLKMSHALRQPQLRLIRVGDARLDLVGWQWRCAK